MKSSGQREIPWIDSEDGAVSLRLWAKNATIKAQDPIVLVAELVNKSETPITILRPFGDDYVVRTAGIELRGPGGLLNYTGPSLTYVIGKDAFATLKPQESLTDSLELTLDNFAGSDVPGRYAISHVYSYDGNWDTIAAHHGVAGVWRGSIKSPVVVVEKR